MPKWFMGLLVSFWVAGAAQAMDDWPDTHPCTGEPIPLTTEKSVVAAIECLYNGRVAKVQKVDADEWYYKIRVVSTGGRIKSIDVHPQLGLPLDPEELESVYENLDS